MLRAVLTALAISPLLLPQTPNKLSREEAAQGWVLLFDGESLFGWTPEGGAQWKVVDGVIVAEAGEYGWLRHQATFRDFELHAEFRTAADGNSGLFLRSARSGAPHLTGYELQIFDTHPKFPTGSMVGDQAAVGGRIRANEWQAFDVRFTGQRAEVKLDGRLVLEMQNGKSGAGYIGLQFNPGKKIAFRNIRVRPLGLRSLIEGSSMSGWRKVEPPKPPPAPAEWTVKGGVIHVEKGPGQLESESTYANFILQAGIRTNAKDASHHPNSGIFFRGTPNTWWSGYESQIRNEFAEGEVNKPVDFGTGGIYRNQPTRRVVAKDGEFFIKTITANGRDIVVWVDGFPVTAWRDDKPEGDSVRKQAVLKAGTISLQAHDPTTNLDFRNIRIAEVPPVN